FPGHNSNDQFSIQPGVCFCDSNISWTYPELKGHFIDSQKLDSQPFCIAVLNPTSTCDWDVAVTLPGKRQIALIKGTQQRISFETSITTSKPCWATAAVDQGTLAVGYWRVDGIDLIDLSGHILRQLSKVLDNSCSCSD
ncbi:hypothetical protein ElyMa_002609100, partial [Elysia marginata]